jgi:23S rRNA pseudouridine1911/1915/1917 synthase
MEKITVGQENSGKRLDKFLSEEFFSYTRGKIAKKIKEGDVLVNGVAAKPSYKLETEDQIEIIGEFENGELFPNPQLEVEIIFEDENLIAINKPAGMQVHPSSLDNKNTLVNWLVAKYPQIKDVHDGSLGAEIRPGIVHRLDRDTSGVIVVAKNLNAFGELKKVFKEKLGQKEYLAIVYGKLPQAKGIIDKPLAKAASYRKQTIAGKRTKTTVREAITEFEVEKEIGKYSVVKVWPKTGRTHQIRIHLSSLGNHIVGDQLYCPRNLNKKETLAPRQMLHAKRLEFELFGKKYEFSSPVPVDMTDFLAKISQ